MNSPSVRLVLCVPPVRFVLPPLSSLRVWFAQPLLACPPLTRSVAARPTPAPASLSVEDRVTRLERGVQHVETMVNQFGGSLLRLVDTFEDDVRGHVRGSSAPPFLRPAPVPVVGPEPRTIGLTWEPVSVPFRSRVPVYDDGIEYLSSRDSKGSMQVLRVGSLAHERGLGS